MSLLAVAAALLLATATHAIAPCQAERDGAAHARAAACPSRGPMSTRESQSCLSLTRSPSSRLILRQPVRRPLRRRAAATRADRRPRQSTAVGAGRTSTRYCPAAGRALGCCPGEPSSSEIRPPSVSTAAPRPPATQNSAVQSLDALSEMRKTVEPDQPVSSRETPCPPTQR